MSNKLKRNYIQLVTGIKKDGSPEIETYLTPHFIPADVWYETVDVMEEMESLEETAKERQESGEKVSQSKLMREQIEMLIDMVVKIYGNQFDKKQLKSGLHAPNMLEDLQQQVVFIARGQQDEATKKFVESKS